MFRNKRGLINNIIVFTILNEEPMEGVRIETDRLQLEVAIAHEE